MRSPPEPEGHSCVSLSCDVNKTMNIQTGGHMGFGDSFDSASVFLSTPLETVIS